MEIFSCTTCGRSHELAMCMGASAPAPWFEIPEEDRFKRAFLSSDQCVIDEERFYVLGRLVIPVVDAPESFVWMAWVELSESDFLRIDDLWETPGREVEPPFLGRLQSTFPYEPPTRGLRVVIRLNPIGWRPTIEIDEPEHPLALEQSRGIALTRIEELTEWSAHTR